MSEEPKFRCDRCGLCCRKLKGSPLAVFDRGDGVCRYLDDNNLCSIYENRPLICNVDKLYDKKYSGRITREVYHLLQEQACKELKEEANQLLGGRMHLLCDAIKIFEELSPTPLEQDINKFQEHHKVKSVDVKTQQKSQKGIMLGDRVAGGTDIYNVYIATICYVRDLTQERVDEDVEKWISEKVNRKFKNFSTGPARIFSVETLQPVSVQDRMREYAEECMASDEFKELRSRLEAKYSAPDGGEKL